MLRFLIRFVGYVLIAIGFASLVVDGTASIGAGTLRWTLFGRLIEAARPQSLMSLEEYAKANWHPALWDPVLVSILAAPAILVFMLVGLVLVIAARHPRPEIGFMPMQ